MCFGDAVVGRPALLVSPNACRHLWQQWQHMPQTSADNCGVCGAGDPEVVYLDDRHGTNPSIRLMQLNDNVHMQATRGWCTWTSRRRGWTLLPTSTRLLQLK